ncbi:MAG: FAD-binding oxidoreductase [Thermoflexales bacterium]|nr:FAD-binding oxidoreductase [Thermoflexales bacterium]
MTLPATTDVVIIGGGVMGASCAYHLALKGCRNVVLLERNRLFGSEATGKCAGGIRYQFDTEINIRLSILSLPMLERFEEELGQAIDVRKCGYLFVLTREEDVVEFKRQVRLQNSLGVNTQWIDGDELRRRLPLMQYPDALGGTWGPEDGLADPNGVVQGYISGARRLGVRCLTDAEVTAIRVSAGQVRGVETQQGFIETPLVVNAAGPWAGQVGALAGVDVPVMPVRRQIAVTTPIPSLPPDFPFVIEFARSLYFHREGLGLLSGMSNHDEPASFNQGLDSDWELVHFEAACQRMPGLECAGVAGRWAGLYENTPDAHPILGAVEELSGFYCIAGFSGHGFMHGPICGLLLAEEILEAQASTLDISPLRLNRFRAGGTGRHSEMGRHPMTREYNVV